MKSLFATAVLIGLHTAWAQPTPAPATGDILCSVDTSAASQKDTVAADADADGFVSIFDGSTFKGWWQDCLTAHTDDKVNGAVFRVDPALHAVYSSQRNGKTGGILSTKKRYRHYEIIFDLWAGWGNDGGFFNRMTRTGQAWQTLLDYLPGRGFGGSYGEGYVVDFALKPFNLGQNDSTITIPGTAYKDYPAGNWTEETAKLTALGEPSGCAATGCTPADWRANWKPSSSATDGWNTLRIKFYGGLGKGQSMTGDKVHMHSYFLGRGGPASGPVDAMHWISIAFDSLVLTDAQLAGAPMNPIGVQVHGGAGAFPNARGTWYRNFRMRELDSLGKPLHRTGTAVKPALPSQALSAGAGLRRTAEGLIGAIAFDHDIAISDAAGRFVASFKGSAGAVRYRLPASARGVLWMTLRTSRGTERIRLAKPAG